MAKFLQLANLWLNLEQVVAIELVRGTAEQDKITSAKVHHAGGVYEVTGQERLKLLSDFLDQHRLSQ